jgi:putative ATPase
VRGSDPDAALYWLAKMLAAGEDPRFIIRRLIVLASEDIGLADPHAISVAASTSTAFEYIGMPEGIFPIVEATLYLATAPKSNSVMAYFSIKSLMEKEGMGQVPTHLMDSNRDAKGFGHGKGYQYPHNFPGHFVAQQYLPDHLKNTNFYQPSQEGYEAEISQRISDWRKQQSEGLEKLKKGE